ncbi:hypothetical protein [Thermus thermamylovorans]|uniref:Uncharacterized protein n=1 Tax=Thermus thermamylovorans TaxID=2509362 RepID=A0A4Q9B6X7_9DEIN|nr:hypothetical protein [Thermus thermamylovorans]TBH21884.1 hypothetical protein ETP66_01195 [Thermus thermamylovorans]
MGFPPLHRHIALLSVLPFAIQFVGIGFSDALGEGLCGSVFGIPLREAVLYGLVSEYYYYGQFFLLLLSLKAAYALGLLIQGSLAENPALPSWARRAGLALSALYLGAFLLTRTLPLPFVTPVGPALLSPAPLDPLSAMMVLPEPFLLWLLLRGRP